MVAQLAATWTNRNAAWPDRQCLVQWSSIPHLGKETWWNLMIIWYIIIIIVSVWIYDLCNEVFLQILWHLHILSIVCFHSLCGTGAISFHKDVIPQLLVVSGCTNFCMDCQLSEWTAWSKCSKSCSGGVQHRLRDEVLLSGIWISSMLSKL